MDRGYVGMEHFATPSDAPHSDRGDALLYPKRILVAASTADCLSSLCGYYVPAHEGLDTHVGKSNKEMLRSFASGPSVIVS
jgi:hypothetical protein